MKASATETYIVHSEDDLLAIRHVDQNDQDELTSCGRNCLDRQTIPSLQLRSFRQLPVAKLTSEPNTSITQTILVPVSTALL